MTDTQGDLTERARAIADASIDARTCCAAKYPPCQTQAWRALLAMEIAAFVQSEREAAAAETRRACEQIADRYADNPPSRDNNNTPQAFEQGMDHRAGAVDCALCIRDAIAALASPAPQETR